MRVVTVTDYKDDFRVKLHLAHNRGFSWYQNGQCYAKGYLFNENGQYYEGQRLLDYFGQSKTVDELETRVQRANGCFSCVIQLNRDFIAIVDRLRSMPLFYSATATGRFLSDDADWIRQQLGNPVPDEAAVQEFRVTHYVTGNDTLFRVIKQLRAGEFIRIAEGRDAASITSTRYHICGPREPYQQPIIDLYSMLEEVLTRVFERLLRSTRGRTLVVPLSRGVDSTSIVLMLRKLGREDVLCFSYGKPGNPESERSKYVAKKLGYPWVFVPYTNQKWQQWFNTKERQEYDRYAEGWSCISHLQDWPAVWQLKREHAIPDDAIFVPGHTVVGMSNALPAQGGEKDVLRTILASWYSSVDWSNQYAELAPVFENRIRQVFSGMPTQTWEQGARAAEFWKQQEREAKFIINSVRVYEFWGYQWRMPLCDNKLTDFWEQVPCHLRIGKGLYTKYVHGKLGRSDSLFTRWDFVKSSARLLLRQTYRKARILAKCKNAYEGFKKALKKRRRATSVYHGDPLAMYSQVPWEQFKRSYTGVEPPRYFRVLERLRELSNTVGNNHQGNKS